MYLIRENFGKNNFSEMKMKCNKCKNKSWKKSCNNCKELEHSCYVWKNMIRVKDYIEHLGYHYSDPDQYLACSMCNVYRANI